MIAPDQDSPPALDHDDIQGLIARAYPNLTAAGYLLLRIDNARPAAAWLGQHVAEVTPAPAHPSNIALNIAFTPSGLQKLGLGDDVLFQFSNEFRTGMVTPHRQRTLGDLGDSAPDHWLWGGPNTPTVDMLLLLFASDEATLQQHHTRLAETFANGGLTELLNLETMVDLDGREHFGFADGISQPTIAGLSARMDTPPNTVQPGEFILGYLNEYGHYTDRPLLDPSADPRRILPPDVQGSQRVDLGRNGSYVVFRQLSQDVRGFWQFLDRATRDGDGTAHPDERTRLGAKVVGRWPSGAPVTLAPDADDPTLASANDFTYVHGDVDGLKCPIGAHVRRSHPRDSLDPSPGTAESVSLDKRHRLLRRGREYGPPVDDPLAATPSDDPDRGIYFVAVAGNISRQFELIQHTWLNNPKFDGLYDETDPLTANHTALGSAFSVPAEPLRHRYTDLPNFVTVRGGAYFFLPGLRALRYLSTLQPGNVSSPVGS
jgi:Dyp-type peroxidase family